MIPRFWKQSSSTKAALFSMIQKLVIYFFIIIFFISGVSLVAASDLTSSTFIVRDPVIGTGGGYAASGSFQMFQSLDPTLIGVNSSTSFLGHYGFLYFSGTSITPTPTPTPSSGGGVRPINNIAVCGKIADFNCDGRVDILDLSILLYYVGKSSPVIDPYDLSVDGKIDLKDISVMFYYWDA